MPKIENLPISESDLAEFVQTQDDFAFELQVFRVCRQADSEALHGGTYQDPITRFNRQFDIRMRLAQGFATMAMAIECKNLSSHFPLLVSRVPRLREEASHDVLINCPLGVNVSKIRGVKTFYPRGELVGKAMTQVGRNAKQNGKAPFEKFTSGDADVYSKWSQAVHSAYDLLTAAARPGGHIELTVVRPVLVVPNGTLWIVDYAADGQRLVNPTQVEECTLFLGKTYELVAGNADLLTYTMTHLHITTINGLATLLRFDEDTAEDFFPAPPDTIC